MAHKFIVMADWCEYTAHCDCVAETEADAVKVYENTFSPDERRSLSVNVVNCTERPDMEKFWHYDGWRSYSGGYRYDSV